MFVHPTGLNNAPLIFNVGAGQTTSQFNTLALVAEPLADVPPTVPPSCNVQEAILTADPADPTFNVSVTCASNAECQGARTCVNTGGIFRCTGHASAACCSHVNTGACLITDPYCSVCMPSLAIGGGDGHTFRLRSKLYPTMYVVASPSAGGVVAGVQLVFSDDPALTGAGDGASAVGAWTMIEKPDFFFNLAPSNQYVPDGSFLLRPTTAPLIVQPQYGVLPEAPLVFAEGRTHWNVIAFDVVQYPDPTDFTLFKLRHHHSEDRWVVPMGGVRPWGLSDNTMLIFGDEDEPFYRIGFDLILSPYEAPYNNQGAVATGTSFILKHHTYNCYVGPKSGGANPIAERDPLVWYNLGPPQGLTADQYYNYAFVMENQAGQ
ncbi:hypothetical protein Ctob_011802, partial [Chrysochromulina tobinii]